MKKFLTENWKTLIVVLISILVFSFVIIQFANTLEQKKINDFSIENFRKTLIDSVKSDFEKQKNDEIDSIKIINHRQILYISKKVSYFENVANLQKKTANKLKIKADSIAKNREECTDISDTYKLAYDSLKSENTALDSTNYFLDLEAQKYSENWYLTEKQLKSANQTIERKDSLILLKNNYILALEKKSKKKSWFNGFKYGFGAGYVSGIGTAILIK